MMAGDKTGSPHNDQSICGPVAPLVQRRQSSTRKEHCFTDALLPLVVCPLIGPNNAASLLITLHHIFLATCMENEVEEINQHGTDIPVKRRGCVLYTLSLSRRPS